MQLDKTCKFLFKTVHISIRKVKYGVKKRLYNTIDKREIHEISPSMCECSGSEIDFHRKSNLADL